MLKSANHWTQRVDLCLISDNVPLKLKFRAALDEQDVREVF